MAEDIVDDLREAICNSIPYVNTNVVQAAIDGDFSNSPQWVWRNHENGVVGFGRWPDDPDAAPYIRADLICAALARMSTPHALGFKAGIEAAAERAIELTKKWGNPVGTQYEQGVQDHGHRLHFAITSLPTPPSPLSEILEAMRPFAVTDTAWNGEPDSLVIELRGVDDEPQPCVHLGDIRRLVAVVTKFGGGLVVEGEIHDRFVNELGNSIEIIIRGPTSESTNVLTQMEAEHLSAALAAKLGGTHD